MAGRDWGERFLNIEGAWSVILMAMGDGSGDVNGIGQDAWTTPTTERAGY